MARGNGGRRGAGPRGGRVAKPRCARPLSLSITGIVAPADPTPGPSGLQSRNGSLAPADPTPGPFGLQSRYHRGGSGGVRGVHTSQRQNPAGNADPSGEVCEISRGFSYVDVAAPKLWNERSRCRSRLLVPGEGSEDDDEELVDIEDNVDEYKYLVDPLALADPETAAILESMDTKDDLALRSVLVPGPDQDLLQFDWRREPEHFEGIRELFNVRSGPTFDNTELTPLDVFLKIWDSDIIAHIVRATNRHAGEISRRTKDPHSRIRRWQEVTEEEILTFFAIVMMQSLVSVSVEREYWHPGLEELRIGKFTSIMTYNRFLAIKSCLHFEDNAALPVHPSRLHKIMPIIDHLNNKFSSLYILEQNVAIDESLLLWKGQLPFSRRISTKKARGPSIKSYELCEPRTGYLWRMEIYTGKGHVAQEGAQEPVEEHEEDVPGSATSRIVLSLMRPLFNRGHTVVMDSFYNAPLLSRLLKVKHKTDSMGTLRLNREFVPECLKAKAKSDMRTGEVAFSSTKDLNVVVWNDKNIVSMISTYHPINDAGIERYGFYRYKPQVVLDYNLSREGIDLKNQMLHAYPIERVRNFTWYKKLFRRLFNVSIHNAFVIFNHDRTEALGNREFRSQLVKELLQMVRPQPLPRPLSRPLPRPLPLDPSQMHLPAKNDRQQRCKLCYVHKVRRTTVWRCSTCAVNLCIDRCYTAYHNQ